MECLPPFVIVMYEENLKEFTSEKIGINVDELSSRLDAFFQENENKNISIMESIRIISLRADGDTERADWFLLQNRRIAGDN